MKYYKLTNSINIEEIGNYPQSILPISKGNIAIFGFRNELIPNIDLPKPALHKKTKETSYIKIDSISNLIFFVLKKSF
ncbi:hypothetical protein [Tenacibaculum maritimum]|uniref:hypothetical protein n=1 Tax=Tenacibaculum maritimum TaxID=107401 RepID=UPI00387632AE